MKDAAIKKFDADLSRLLESDSRERETVQLQAELAHIYRVVVLLQKNEPATERAAEIWAKMVAICDAFARRLSALAAKYPACRTSHDRILDLRNASEERRRLHLSA